MQHGEHFMSAAKPLYGIGDLVAFWGNTEQGTEYGLAYITGLEYQPPHHFVGDWWYAVRVVTPEQHYNYDNMPEYSIIGRVIHGT
jgi:hypothetical protein